jgi:lysozyme
VKTSPAGRERIAKHEGCVLTAYPDPGTGGEPWTIGVGHTGDVKKGDRITHEQAMAFLAADLRTAEVAVETLVKVPLNQNQFDALVSFVFNVGPGAFRGSTLLRKLNLGDYGGAAYQLLVWCRAGGKVMAGLLRRRNDERDLFLTKD